MFDAAELAQTFQIEEEIVFAFFNAGVEKAFFVVTEDGLGVDSGNFCKDIEGVAGFGVFSVDRGFGVLVGVVGVHGGGRFFIGRCEGGRSRHRVAFPKVPVPHWSTTREV